MGDKEPAAPAAYIPTPDSTGVVHNYAELYAAGRWKEPYHHIKSSDTVEEATSFALANGFIYYMDERDKEWLDKNNEQARGEGMSTQSASAAPTRSGRSAKAKGKEPDIVQPVSITEDEFELVMAIFEKVTHEKTEFLHHVSLQGGQQLDVSFTLSQGLEQGAPFPPFSDYQDTFAAPLPAEMFAMYSLPSWIPPAQQMLRYSRIIYPYWRERRQDRGGHRIIPTVNVSKRIDLVFSTLTISAPFSSTKATRSTSPISVSGDEKSRPFGRLEPHKRRTPIVWSGCKPNSQRHSTSYGSYSDASSSSATYSLKGMLSGECVKASWISRGHTHLLVQRRTTTSSWTKKSHRRSPRWTRRTFAFTREYSHYLTLCVVASRFALLGTMWTRGHLYHYPSRRFARANVKPQSNWRSTRSFSAAETANGRTSAT